jgi:anti-sigma regulatory factor (Ser/Thr protein kinase)
MQIEELVVTSALDELPRVIDFVHRACVSAAVPEDVAFACQLAADEACTNIMEHAYAGRSDGAIRISLRINANQVHLIFHDQGVAFDPNLIEAPHLGGDLVDRQIGGLGLHFMRSLMDEVRFEFDPAIGNTLTMTKRLPQAH